MTKSMDHARAEMRRVLKDHTFALDAVERADLGSVSFYWGDEKAGLAHIIKRRMEADGLIRAEAEALCVDLVEVIAKGKAVQNRGSKITVELGNLQAVLALYRDGKKKSWLLSGFQLLKKGSGASVAERSTHGATSGKLSGRATPEGADGIQSTSPRKPRKVNPPAFGTKERRKAYGAQEGGSRSGARAERKRKRKVGRKAATRAEELFTRLGKAEADGKKLTKTQRAALQKAEKRLQVEGALPDDARMRQLAKEHQAQERALDAVLGKERQVYAVKVAREDRPFDRADLEAYQSSGWRVLGTGTAPAKVGKSLAALNPTDEISRVLGPKGEARAFVLAYTSPFGEDAVRSLQAEGLDVSAAPKALREGRFKAKKNPTVSGHKGPRGATRKKAVAQAGAMSKISPRTKGTPAAPIAPSRAARRPAAGLPKRASRRPVLPKLNPTDAEDLERVWKAWTGSAPDKTLQLDIQHEAIIPKGRILLPKETVMLGRVSKLFHEDGKVQDFGDAGPLMVTDGGMKRLWLVDAKPRHFDAKVAVIGYLARKPKFGDRGVIEYLHDFASPTTAVMAGQVGAIQGRFRLTPRGIEG